MATQSTVTPVENAQNWEHVWNIIQECITPHPEVLRGEQVSVRAARIAGMLYLLPIYQLSADEQEMFVRGMMKLFIDLKCHHVVVRSENYNYSIRFHIDFYQQKRWWQCFPWQDRSVLVLSKNADSFLPQ